MPYQRHTAHDRDHHLAIVNLVVCLLHNQTAAHLELKASITTKSDDASLARLIRVSDGIKLLHEDLAEARTNRIGGQSGVLAVNKMDSSELTTHNLTLTATQLHQVLRLTNGNIEVVLMFSKNMELLEEV